LSLVGVEPVETHSDPLGEGDNPETETIVLGELLPLLDQVLAFRLVLPSANLDLASPPLELGELQ
jgi:hypothetical protein